ncbi:hypothetical protein L3Q82_019275 [Scortum barcoo]|uniref:Uncharacterized protein n=1 Tax=Scortum barcoo TaxID=214431 RepID=A0ACB8VD75_9TELE|nr:hypothetical protein L3Q82_019275 [Scortum barcoo]
MRVCGVGRLHLIKSFNLDDFASAALFSSTALGQRHNLRSTSSESEPSRAEPRLTARHRQRGEDRAGEDFSRPQRPSVPPAMEREVRFCPKWHGALWLLLFATLCLFLAAEAEISCRSCQPGNKWRPRELLLKFESATGLKGEVLGRGDAAGSAERAPDRPGPTEPGLTRNTDELRAQETRAESGTAEAKVSPDRERVRLRSGGGAGVTTKRARRQSDGEQERVSGSEQQNQDPAEARSRATRSELRWGGEERRAGAPRQDELKLNSSTFALTGDSSHNQAMVHWSGQNSSVSLSLRLTLSISRHTCRSTPRQPRERAAPMCVILMLTKLFDFNLNSVTESSLWRANTGTQEHRDEAGTCSNTGSTGKHKSTDYGATYQKLNDKVGAKTILSYLYVSPNNKRKSVRSNMGRHLTDRSSSPSVAFCNVTDGINELGKKGAVPVNRRKLIMLLTDPEVESSLLISSDEGATYQKYRLNFYILSLLFHPEQEDWILAYSHDQKDEMMYDVLTPTCSLTSGLTLMYHLHPKTASPSIPPPLFGSTAAFVDGGNMELYSSVEFGRRWQLVHERVAPNRFYWSKMGLDKEPGLIHLETSISEGQALYVTCKLQNCTDANKGKPFPGYIDPNSLVVQDEYVFVQVSTAGRPIYYVSAKRDVFTPMKLPKYTLPKDLHVISTDENRVVAAVQEWNQNETYNLYVSDTSGVYYTLALENVVSSMGPEGNVMVDLYEVAGIKGMFLANKKTDNQVKTHITYNRGRDWRLLQAPSKDLRGNSIHCVLVSVCTSASVLRSYVFSYARAPIKERP